MALKSAQGSVRFRGIHVYFLTNNFEFGVVYKTSNLYASLGENTKITIKTSSFSQFYLLQ